MDIERGNIAQFLCFTQCSKCTTCLHHCPTGQHSLPISYKKGDSLSAEEQVRPSFAEARRLEMLVGPICSVPFELR